ncbi:MAG: 5-(carboxyamino)imidazole ribonucleotide mutase [Planctomycetota bacterium]
MPDPRVLVMMASDSDLDATMPCLEVMETFGVPFEIVVASSYRAPHLVERLAREAEGRGIRVIIAVAGMSAHLAGAVASYTILPVIGVPMEHEALKGLDALYSMVQMPRGTPVACMGIGPQGAENAAYQAIQILGLQDEGLRERLYRHRDELSDRVKRQNLRVQDRVGRR